jgi:2-amino-4-hydroxy-6-hydroxymethyldihydropteridine diphosphokinase
MPRYVLLLGSNQDPESQLRAALSRLDQQFGLLRIGVSHASPDRDADPRPPYLNQAVEIASPLNPIELKAELRAIETKLGRDRSAPKPALCAIDIDIVLQFEQSAWQVLDHKTLSFDYAQAPLAPWMTNDSGESLKPV